MTEAQITGLLMALLGLTTLAGLAVVVAPAIWDAAPAVCDAGSRRFACSGLGSILLIDLPLLGVPGVWAVGLAGIGLHRGRRPVWTALSFSALAAIYLTDFWIAAA
jgi:hypothetical protein